MVRSKQLLRSDVSDVDDNDYESFFQLSRVCRWISEGPKPALRRIVQWSIAVQQKGNGKFEFL